MREAGWHTLYPKRRTTCPGLDAHKYPYLLKGLSIVRCNQVWEVDITYIPMRKGFMYLVAIIDVYSRYVVGWDVDNTMSAEWCCSVLEETIRKHGRPEIINTDQGSQFTSQRWVSFLVSAGVRISMDGRGRALDDIYIERLWRSVKQEYVYLQVCEEGLELWHGMYQYFHFYNGERFHQSLGYKVPEEIYRREAKEEVIEVIEAKTRGSHSVSATPSLHEPRVWKKRKKELIL